MIVILKHGVSDAQTENLVAWFESQGLRINLSHDEYHTIIGLIGKTDKIDVDLLEGMEIVESVKLVSDPFKKGNRKYHPVSTVVDVSGIKIGEGHFQMIAGPCSVESEEQIMEVAVRVKAAGATMLRGGAFKPRTSPYDFQGMRAEGIELLLKARAQTGLPIVTELMAVDQLPLFEEVDVIQVGARNMQNFDLLREVGKFGKPVLLKRGLANTLKEMLMSVEYIMAEGNDNVILCERGIRTFETYTRNTLDISAVTALKELSHLPVIVDPSHASGIARFVAPMSLASAAAGADGLIIEVHNNPAIALCDGPQSLTPDQFDDLADKVRKVLAVVNG